MVDDLRITRMFIGSAMEPPASLPAKRLTSIVADATSLPTGAVAALRVLAVGRSRRGEPVDGEAARQVARGLLEKFGEAW